MMASWLVRRPALLVCAVAQLLKEHVLGGDQEALGFDKWLYSSHLLNTLSAIHPVCSNATLLYNERTAVQEETFR